MVDKRSSKPEGPRPSPEIDVDPGTLLAIVVALLLIPLLLSGFIFQ
ncbi:MAG: hypothetical protein HC825_03045 [Oscillatoriales cyanobacterium RM1_1_9]|nr:hypothetical protein [Oscillatoriales cyanobacterium SM2_3_0]NJO44432.1 hypothetical protein [Oscillatoriales cyanobacterium RM2_1_1]NJO70944.1 hypothetical protein [Oscillatoriales cyanobacterium RM1_1_9]